MSDGLYDRPVLVVDLDMHTAPVRRASADQNKRWAVTGSHDKTLRVWSLADGALVRTIRLPAGAENVGKVFALAMSPDGALIAAGGSTGTDGPKAIHSIYLFDRATGMLVRRIDDVSNVALHLVFSRDGERLAVSLDGGGGLRVYARQLGWAEVARDESYTGCTYGADFAPDGRLATTSHDGATLRIYACDLAGRIRPQVPPINMTGGRWPFRIAFSPDGTRLAVGYEDTTKLDLLDGHTFAAAERPDLAGIDNGNLHMVAWSRHGQTLFAGGEYESGGGRPVLAWSGAGIGARRAMPPSEETVMGLVPLLDGDLLVASADPRIARLGPDGTPRWVHGRQTADFRNQHDQLLVSDDGARVGFGFERFGRSPACFDVADLKLILAPAPDGRMSAPRQDGLLYGLGEGVCRIRGWKGSKRTMIDLEHGSHYGGVELDAGTSRSLAIHPTGVGFVLGCESRLFAYDTQGRITVSWRRSTPATVWAVNITRDGRLVVAAYGDGTIHWHRVQDGVELLAFMPLADRINWVAWTPEGYYAATAGAQGMLRWHVNRGWDQPADSIPVAEIPGSYRPDVLRLVLQEGETARALGLAELARHKREVMLRTNSHVLPGTRLHLLAMGISAYNEEFAKDLRLHYADRDANDLASAIVNTQASLYQVKPQVLTDKDANKTGILDALKVVRDGMAAGTGNDLAVVFFSGHGAMVEGKLYLLPSEVDARDEVRVRSSALWIGDLKDELLKLASHGRVLVLLDACHSGATTMSGTVLAMDSTALRTGLAAANVTVLTSSSDGESSFEHPDWQHGAFTKVLLESFDDPAADLHKNRLISAIGLTSYVAMRVPTLTGGRQNPGMEVRFEGTLFASAI